MIRRRWNTYTWNRSVCALRCECVGVGGRTTWYPNKSIWSIQNRVRALINPASDSIRLYFFLFLFNLLYYFWPVCNELVQHIAHDQIDEVYGMIVADGSLCVDHCCAHGLFNINPKQRKSIENCTHVSFSFGNNWFQKHHIARDANWNRFDWRKLNRRVFGRVHV